MQEICVIGTGYVGLVLSVGLADLGHTVTGVDIDSKKIEMLNQQTPPIYELGMREILTKNMAHKRLFFSTDVDGTIKRCDTIFIAIGTPQEEGGAANLTYLKASLKTVAENLNGYKTVVIKSTVPVGTNRWAFQYIKSLNRDADFDVVSNPEFLREGKALHDFFHPDRTVVGHTTERAANKMKLVYASFLRSSSPFVFTEWETAELIKYASNVFLATKITFMNQIAHFAEECGADVHQVAKAMGLDGRISSKFLHPGPGYGGSCFPKDVRALIKSGKDYSVDLSLIESVAEGNEKQKLRMVDKVETLLGGVKGKQIAILGLTFKPETDDIRESSSLVMVEELLKRGATLRAHDPEGVDNFRKLYPQIDYSAESIDAVDGADCAVIMTEWYEYRSLDLKEMKKRMKKAILVDTRGLFSYEYLLSQGFIYYKIGLGSTTKDDNS